MISPGVQRFAKSFRGGSGPRGGSRSSGAGSVRGHVAALPARPPRGAARLLFFFFPGGHVSEWVPSTCRSGRFFGRPARRKHPPPPPIGPVGRCPAGGGRSWAGRWGTGVGSAGGRGCGAAARRGALQPPPAARGPAARCASTPRWSAAISSCRREMCLGCTRRMCARASLQRSMRRRAAAPGCRASSSARACAASAASASRFL